MTDEAIRDRHDRTARLLHPFDGIVGQNFRRVHCASNHLRGELAVEARSDRLRSRGRNLLGIGQVPTRRLSGYVAGPVIARSFLAAVAPPPRMPQKKQAPSALPGACSGCCQPTTLVAHQCTERLRSGPE